MRTRATQERRNRTRMILFALLVLVLAGSFVAILVVWRISANPSLLR